MDWTQTLMVILCGLSAIIIILLVSMLRTLSKQTEKSKNVAPQATNELVVKSSTKNVTAVQNTEELELIAVITAAVAATLGTTADRLVVTSFKQLSTKTHWFAR